MGRRIPESDQHGSRRPSLYKLLPVALLLIGLVLFFALGLNDYLTFAALRENRAGLLAWVDRTGVWAVVVFTLAYAGVVAVSVPIGTVLTVVAGFLFGPVVATVAVVVGATTGATGLFVAARTAFGDFLRSKVGPSVAGMTRGFEEDAFSYLLTLRLVPIVPFWLVNIVPAFTRVSLATFVSATAIGIIPGTLVYALAGNGLGAVFDAGGTPDLGIIFEPEILAPIVGLAVLSLVPVVYKRLRRRRDAPATCERADGMGQEKRP